MKNVLCVVVVTLFFLFFVPSPIMSAQSPHDVIVKEKTKVIFDLATYIVDCVVNDQSPNEEFFHKQIRKLESLSRLKRPNTNNFSFHRNEDNDEYEIRQGVVVGNQFGDIHPASIQTAPPMIKAALLYGSILLNLVQISWGVHMKTTPARRAAQEQLNGTPVDQYLGHLVGDAVYSRAVTVADRQQERDEKVAKKEKLRQLGFTVHKEMLDGVFNASSPGADELLDIFRFSSSTQEELRRHLETPEPSKALQIVYGREPTDIDDLINDLYDPVHEQIKRGVQRYLIELNLQASRSFRDVVTKASEILYQNRAVIAAFSGSEPNDYVDTGVPNIKFHVDTLAYLVAFCASLLLTALLQKRKDPETFWATVRAVTDMYMCVRILQAIGELGLLEPNILPIEALSVVALRIIAGSHAPSKLSWVPWVAWYRDVPRVVAKTEHIRNSVMMYRLCRILCPLAFGLVRVVYMSQNPWDVLKLAETVALILDPEQIKQLKEEILGGFDLIATVFTEVYQIDELKTLKHNVAHAQVDVDTKQIMTNTINEKIEMVKKLEVEVKDKTEKMEKTTQKVEKLEKEKQEMERELEQQREELNRKENAIGQKNQRIDELNNVIAQQRSEITMIKSTPKKSALKKERVEVSPHAQMQVYDRTAAPSTSTSTPSTSRQLFRDDDNRHVERKEERLPPTRHITTTTPHPEFTHDLTFEQIMALDRDKRKRYADWLRSHA